MATMFDTNFTFLSSSTEPLVVDYSTSTDISPFTSRCSSPQVSMSRSSHHRSSRDIRFDSYRPSRQQSITALTAQLQSHGIQDRRPSYITVDDEEQSTESEQDDEGFYDGPDTPATSVSDLSSSEFDPTLYDLSMSEISATSSPRPSLSLEAQALSSHTTRRRQRQALVRLQCLARRAPDLAMLIEECHPSSLPLTSDALWAASSRSDSTCSTSGMSCGRIEKERAVSVRRMPRMRKRTTR